MKYQFMILLLLASCISLPNKLPTSIATIDTISVGATKPYTETSNANINNREYIPSEWSLIYDGDMVWQSEIGTDQTLWIATEQGKVAYFQGGEWTYFSGHDYGFFDKPNSMAIALDGTVWVSGRETLARYRQGHWDTFSIPNMSETAFTRLAVDSSGVVWVATQLCRCKNSIKRFDGNIWDELSIDNTELAEIGQLVFSSNGDLWISSARDGSIANYNGVEWKIYQAESLWETVGQMNIGIAPDKQGGIIGIDGGQWLTRINADGMVSTIPFESSVLELNPALIRLFVDSQNTIWVNACLRDRKNACLAYYKDNRWFYFTDMPFSFVTDINELPSEILLFSTEKGLYKFTPAK